jgi:phosphatidylserine/phosphatidylglycerophosphate/cardiolipin synthase-like enzyme
VVLNRRLGWLPAVDGNKAELFSDYDESIAAMAREVRTAERYVHVEFYIMSWDATTNDFFEALAEVAARGVKVRLLFDHIGTARIPGYRDMIKKLELTAIEWHPMLPTSPYFVPDDSLLYAITTAAQRGIDVELFVGEQGDQFMVHHAQISHYTALLRAGVKIYLYPAPFVLHSKHFSVDDDVAVIGSSNMDIRSFNLDFEISVMCVSRSLTTAMRKVEDHYRSLSEELTLAEWRRRPLVKRYIDNVMRLTSALQ